MMKNRLLPNYNNIFPLLYDKSVDFEQFIEKKVKEYSSIPCITKVNFEDIERC